MNDKQMKEILVFMIGIIFLYCLIDYKEDKKHKLELEDCNNSFKTIDSLYNVKSEKLKYYSAVSLKQSSIISSFKSSREKAKKDSGLIKLYIKIED